MPETFIPLALKYRPQKFSHIIGQEVPVNVLRNSLVKGTVYPSLVFYGHYGSGKTTLARIYAKAVNCTNLGKDGEPCCECASCTDIASGRSMSYMEQDAASAGTVDHARKIGELIAFRSLGKFRVVVLDEAHAATTAAWNAMLKYVEEPPPNVVFIFVTTEVAKIPDTILSRCFAIPFRGVAPHEVVARLADVAAAEAIPLESREILYSIVQRTGGAVRDALVMLDQARMVSNGQPITMMTLQPLGFCDPSIFIEFLSLWKEEKIDNAISLFRQWSPLIGPEAFLRGLEDILYREILLSVGVEPGRSERKAMLRLSLGDLWQCIKKIWRVKDMANLDLGRIEATLVCTLFRLADEAPAAVSPTAVAPAKSASPLPAPVAPAAPPPPPRTVDSEDELQKLLQEELPTKK